MSYETRGGGFSKVGAMTTHPSHTPFRNRFTAFVAVAATSLAFADVESTEFSYELDGHSISFDLHKA